MHAEAAPADGFRVILVVRAGEAWPHGGGGQRTRVIFEAACRSAPTQIIVIGHDIPVDIADAFPGAAAVHPVETGSFAADQRIGTIAVPRTMAIRHLARMAQSYRAEPPIADAVAKIVDAVPGRAVVVIRYFRTAVAAGLDRDLGEDRRVIIDFDDRDDQVVESMLEQRFGRLAARLIGRPLFVAPIRRLLRRGAGRAAHVWFSAPEDRLTGDATAHSVIENVPFDVPEQVPPASGGGDILFIGSTQYLPNRAGIRWFIAACWPQIRAAHPTARLRLVGSGRPDAVTSEMPDGVLEGVDILGRVADLAPEYARARLAISPVMIGGGTKIKVIEACAHGRPVVATAHSIRGLDPQIRVKLIVAEDAEAMVAGCCRLLAEPAHADALGAALRALQRGRHSREGVTERIVSDIRRVARP